LIPSVQVTSTWGIGAGHEPAVVASFAPLVDYHLATHAPHESHGGAHEVVAHSAKRTKTPDTCRGMRVKYVAPLERLRTERAKFGTEH
jgi:hypothetical protein